MKNYLLLTALFALHLVIGHNRITLSNDVMGSLINRTSNTPVKTDETYTSNDLSIDYLNSSISYPSPVLEERNVNSMICLTPYLLTG